MVVDKVFNDEFKVNQVRFATFQEAHEELVRFTNKFVGKNTELFVVFVDHTDDVGKIESRDVYLSETYIEIANLIASYDYAKNTAVDVYSVLGNEYVYIKHKYFNGICFESCACCNVSTYELRFVSRKMWDIGTIIHY